MKKRSVARLGSALDCSASARGQSRRSALRFVTSSSRTERSALAAAAQPYQDLIDALFFGMAGLTAEEVTALQGRYAKML